MVPEWTRLRADLSHRNGEHQPECEPEVLHEAQPRVPRVSGSRRQCNEEEWWYYTKAEIRCVNQTTGAYTVVGTCAWAVLSRTKSGHMCPACLEPVE